MTVDTAILQFKLGMDKIDSFNSANLLPEEISVYLSDAQEEFIEQRAYGNNTKRLGVEESQKRVKDLQDITYNANLRSFFNNNNNKPNGTFVSLPDGVTVQDIDGNIPPKYRHSINESCTLTYLDCNNKTQSIVVQVVPISHDKYNKVISSPFSQPSNNKVYRLPYGRVNSLETFELVLAPTQTLVTYHIRYLKNPTKIDQTQILVPSGLHGSNQMDLTDESYREIIRIAIRNCLGDIESSRVQESIERNTEIE